MGRMKEELMRMKETAYMDECPECHGDGTVTCETCKGAKEVERLCYECSDWVTINVPEDAILCDNCIDIRDNRDGENV